MRKPLLLLPAVLLIGYAAVRVPSTFAQAGENGKTAPVAEHVKKLYQMDCAICHGATGDGKTDLGKDMGVTSDFTDPKTFAGKTDDELMQIIRKGKDKMPPEDAGRAKDADVKALVAYLRTLSKNGPAPAAAPAPAAQPEAAAPSSN